MFTRLIMLAALCLPMADCCFDQRYAHAQINIIESKVAYWTGFEEPQIVGGQLVAKVSSKPKLDRVETTIRVDTVVDYKFGQLRARRLPSYERVTLDEVSKNVFKFKAGTPEGKYLLEYNAFDPEKGIASDEATITLERGPVPQPDEPIGPELSPLATQSRKAMASLVQAMASDMDKAADAVDAGKVTTVLKLAELTVPLDVETRNAFKKAMAGPLEPVLGKDKLAPGASQALRDVAAGFRSVK